MDTAITLFEQINNARAKANLPVLGQYEPALEQGGWAHINSAELVISDEDEGRAEGVDVGDFLIAQIDCLLSDSYLFTLIHPLIHPLPFIHSHSSTPIHPLIHPLPFIHSHSSQVASTFSDALRCVLIDSMFKSSGTAIDSLSMLYFISPATTFFVFLGFVVFELKDFPLLVITPSFFGELQVEMYT
jgi:hypothetical protein